MQQALRRSSLVPIGFVVEGAFCEADRTVIIVRPAKTFGLCPSCGAVCRRVHSHYRRRVAELPLSGRIVQLVVIARRFRCEAVLCGRQIFTERYPEGVLARSARRTGRLDGIVHHLGLALGGRPAATFAKRLMLPVSNDTLLRVVSRYTDSPTISYTPITGQQFVNLLLRPIPPATIFSLIDSGHPVDFLLRLTVDSINGLYNYSLAPSRARAEDPKFRRLLAALIRRQLSGSDRSTQAGAPGEWQIIPYPLVIGLHFCIIVATSSCRPCRKR